MVVKEVQDVDLGAVSKSPVGHIGLPPFVRDSPWHPGAFSAEFHHFMSRAGVKARFHDLRHTHATQLLKRGVPINVVSERLGHAKASITLDVYSHVLPSMQQEAAAKVGEMLAGILKQAG